MSAKIAELTGAVTMLEKSVTVKLMSMPKGLELCVNGRLLVPLVICKEVIMPNLMLAIP